MDRSNAHLIIHDPGERCQISPKGAGEFFLKPFESEWFIGPLNNLQNYRYRVCGDGTRFVCIRHAYLLGASPQLECWNSGMMARPGATQVLIAAAGIIVRNLIHKTDTF